MSDKKGINEKLLPLIKVLNRSHPTNNIEECLEYISKIHESMKEIDDLEYSFKRSCGYCVHYGVCKIIEKNRDTYFFDLYKLAWICSKFKKENYE